MRQVEVCHRIHQHRVRLHHNAHRDGYRIFGSEWEAGVCCIRGAPSLCAEDAGRFATVQLQPGIASVAHSCIVSSLETNLLRLSVHGQPVRIETCVVCHGGVDVS
jgi:hypothetical protein